jgi:RHS repeat-associated protein
LYINEYYSYGLQNLQMSSTQYGSKPQNYKYNGKELIKDFKLEQEDFGARLYSPQIGRWCMTDRFASKYMEMTPYHYGANNPIKYIDVNGDSLWITHGTGFLGLGGNETLLYNNGSLYNRDGSAYIGKVNGFLGKAVGSLKQIGRTEEGGTMLAELQSSTNNFSIEKTSGNNEFIPSDKNRGHSNQFSTDPAESSTLAAMNNAGFNLSGGSGGVIRWDGLGAELPTTSGGQSNRTTDLGHELFHALDANRGLLDTRKEQGYARDEWQATYRENILRSQMVQPLRTHYGILMDTQGNFVGGKGPRMLTPANQPLQPSWYKP